MRSYLGVQPQGRHAGKSGKQNCGNSHSKTGWYGRQRPLRSVLVLQREERVRKDGRNEGRKRRRNGERKEGRD